MGKRLKGLIGRRNLLQAVTATGLLLGLGGIASWASRRSAADPYLVRPPGGQDEVRFTSLCIKCNRCTEICPEDVIVNAGVRDGLLVARTPRLDFSLGYCDFCMDCIVVCPTAALLPIRKSEAKLGIAVVMKDRCIPWQWGGCTRCYEKCPEKAIILDELKRPIVVADKCNGCGLCKLVCPTDQLRSYKPGQTRGIEIERS
jgi:ferredoxin-type protein NapG